MDQRHSTTLRVKTLVLVRKHQSASLHHCLTKRLLLFRALIAETPNNSGSPSKPLVESQSSTTGVSLVVSAAQTIDLANKTKQTQPACPACLPALHLHYKSKYQESAQIFSQLRYFQTLQNSKPRLQ